MFKPSYHVKIESKSKRTLAPRFRSKRFSKDIPNCYRYFTGTDNSNVCSLFMFKQNLGAKQESKSKRISEFQSDPSKMYPRSKSKATSRHSKTTNIIPRIPFYFSSLYPYKNQLNSLKNTGIKAKPTLESQMLIKLAKMIWKATKTVQNYSIPETLK